MNRFIITAACFQMQWDQKPYFIFTISSVCSLHKECSALIPAPWGGYITCPRFKWQNEIQTQLPDFSIRWLDCCVTWSDLTFGRNILGRNTVCKSIAS